MDKFVKNFILMSIVYLMVASVLGVLMLGGGYGQLKFVHSHLMLLGWVSMMIYGVGYHILPKFAGRFLRSKAMAVLQFWMANAGLIGMLAFYLVSFYDPATPAWRALSTFFGAVEVLSIGLFFYNMLATIYSKEPE